MSEKLLRALADEAMSALGQERNPETGVGDFELNVLVSRFRPLLRAELDRTKAEQRKAYLDGEKAVAAARKERDRTKAELTTVTAERNRLREALTLVSNMAVRQLAEPVTTHDTAALVSICTAAESALSAPPEPKPEEAKCAECDGRGGYGTTSFEGTCGYCNGTGMAQ